MAAASGLAELPASSKALASKPPPQGAGYESPSDRSEASLPPAMPPLGLSAAGGVRGLEHARCNGCAVAAPRLPPRNRSRPDSRQDSRPGSRQSSCSASPVPPSYQLV
eukprot:4200947-Prymnesium_polylepis.1